MEISCHKHKNLAVKESELLDVRLLQCEPQHFVLNRVLVKSEMPRTQLTQQRGPVQEVGRAPCKLKNSSHEVLISDEAMVKT